MIIEELDDKQIVRQFTFALAGFIVVKLAMTYVIHRAAMSAKKSIATSEVK